MKSVILGGGYGRRMGREKINLEIQGKPVFEFLAEQLIDAEISPYLVLRSDQQISTNLSLSIIRDDRDGQGPLQGIASALSALRDSILVVPCDMPGLTTEIFMNLSRAFTPDVDLVMYQSNAKLQFFPSIWNYKTLDKLHKHLKQDLSIKGIVGELNVRTIAHKGSEAQFFNWNTPEDYTKWQTL